MNFKHAKTVAAVAVILLNANVAVGSSAQMVGSYDFAYMTTGSHRASPVQVFDDGRNTYFQFRAGEAVPAIFTQKNGSMQLLVPEHEGPYIKVPQVHGQFTLQLGRAQAMVVHGDGTRLDAPPLHQVSPSGMTNAYYGGGVTPGARLVASLAPAAPALVDDALERNSYATPTRGDRVGWVQPEISSTEHTIWFPKGSQTMGPQGRKLIQAIAAKARDGGKVIVMGRDDESFKEGLDQARANVMRDALVKAGVPKESIATRIGVAGKSDKNLRESNIRVEIQSSPVVSRHVAAAPAANTSNQANVQALVRSGVLTLEQGNAILSRQGGQVAQTAQGAPQLDVPPGGFRMVAADKNIQTTVRRWAASVNYSVVWDVPPELDAQIGGDALIQAGSMKEAVERLLTGLRQAGYMLDATFYSNRVIRFTKAAPQSEAPSAPVPAARPARHDTHSPTNGEKVIQRASTGAFDPEASGRKWSMRVEDKSMEQMLNRWGRDANWSVVWNANEIVPIDGNAVVEKPSFLNAADYVIAQAANAGYRMKAVAYANNTLVVSSY